MVKEKEIVEKLTKQEAKIKKNEDDVKLLVETLRLHVEITSDAIYSILDQLEKIQKKEPKKKDEVMYQ